MDEGKQQYWEKLEADMLHVIQSLTILTSAQRERVVHFVDHNEFGVAWEELVACLAERGHTPATDIAEQLNELASRMGLEQRVDGSVRKHR